MESFKKAALVILLGVAFFAVNSVQAQDSWHFVRDVDEMTDEVKFTAAYLMNSYGSPGAFGAHCSKEAGLMVLLFDPPGFFLSNKSRTEVIYRIDKQKAVVFPWVVHSDKDAVLVYNVTAVKFLNEIMRGERVLKIQLGSRVYTVPLAGASEAISRLYAECGVADANGTYLW